YEINSDMLNSNQLTFQISANQFSDGDLYTSNGHTMVNNPTNEFNVPPDGRVWVAQAQGADMGPNHPRTRVTKPYIQSYNHVGFDQRRWNLLSNVKRHS